MPRPAGHKLRKGRFSAPGLVYFVTACCDRRLTVFSKPQYAQVLAEELSRRRRQTAGFDSLAYVVMPDHFHWLVRLSADAPLGDALKLVKGRAAYRVNRLAGKKGRIWQSGYHDHALRAEEDLFDAGMYLIYNPVRAGIVQNIDDYPYWDTVWHRRSGLLGPSRGHDRG